MKIYSSRHFLAKLAVRRALRVSRLLPLSVLLFAALSVAPSAHSATGTWQGATDAAWGTDTNWTSGARPVSGDTAFFTNSAATVNNRTTIDLGAGQAAAGVTFDTANAAAYTIGAGAVGSQTLTLDTNSAVSMTATVANNQLFNANIVLGTGATGAAAGTATITNASTTNSLNFAGTVTGGAGGTAGVKTLNTVGAGAINFSGALTPGGGSVLNFANIGTGNTTLSGTGTSTFGTLRATGSGQITVNGQNVTVASASVYGTSTTTSGRFILTSGSVAFNGGISTFANPSDGSLFRVDGGSFSAASVSLGRTQSFTTLPTASSTTSGFIVNGGTANVTGQVTIGTSNSSASALVNGGALTVGGPVVIGVTSNGGRYNPFEVRNGSFTSTDTASGILLSASTTTANLSALLVTGGTTTVQRIGFGVANSLAGSTGVIAVSGGSLYVGSGSIVVASANAYTATVNLSGGLVGAQADWTSSVPMNLTGPATFQAADAGAVAHNISLTGVLGGTGSLTKTGAGVLTLTAPNGYSGLTNINAGTLNINGVNALGGANFAGVTFNGGTLQYATGATGNGSLDVSNIGGTAKPFTVGASGATIDTNGNAVTFANTIGNNGTGALTKAGAGMLTLSAANTYTGGTVISGGTLMVTADGGLSSGNVTIAAGMTLELGTGVTAAHSVNTSTLTLASTSSIVRLDAVMGTVQDTILALIVNGVSQPNGTYGAAGSGATNILPEFAGTGVLAVVPEPSTWLMTLGGMAGLAVLAVRRRRAA